MTSCSEPFAWRCRRALRMAGLMLALGSAAAANAQVAVIVNPHSSIASMTASQIGNLFLGRTPLLPTGATAVLADLPEGSGPRDEFYARIAGKTPDQVKAAWARLLFSGKGAPPREFRSSAELRRFVAGSADAIGYVEKSAVDATVKVVYAWD